MFCDTHQVPIEETETDENSHSIPLFLAKVKFMPALLELKYAANTFKASKNNWWNRQYNYCQED